MHWLVLPSLPLYSSSKLKEGKLKFWRFGFTILCVYKLSTLVLTSKGRWWCALLHSSAAKRPPDTSNGKLIPIDTFEEESQRLLLDALPWVYDCKSDHKMTCRRWIFLTTCLENPHVLFRWQSIHSRCGSRYSLSILCSLIFWSISLTQHLRGHMATLVLLFSCQLTYKHRPR